MTHIDISQKLGKIRSLCGNSKRGDNYTFGAKGDAYSMSNAASRSDCDTCKAIVKGLYSDSDIKLAKQRWEFSNTLPY